MIENEFAIKARNDCKLAIKLSVAVDCIIFGFEDDVLKVLLIKRFDEPNVDRWALLGTSMHKNETLNEAVQRVLLNYTGLKKVYLNQLKTISSIDRDPIERTLSVAYFALINIRFHKKNY